MTYEEFLFAKLQFAKPTGFEVAAQAVNPLCRPHQTDIIRWKILGGQRANFASFGLGKTIMQQEPARIIQRRKGGRYLQVARLSNRQDFDREGKLDTPEWRAEADAKGLDYDNIVRDFGVDYRFVQRNEEIGEPGIYLTNYETLRDRKLNIDLFDGFGFDEASILRGLGGTKTFREFMGMFEGSDVFRFVDTATPSPNDFVELLAYSAFLGIMDVSQAKTRFFKRNSEKADELTIHEHKKREFWLWVSSWAVYLQKPSDLGYSDEGYELPELDVRWHEIPSATRDAGQEPSGQGRLMSNAALGVVEASREKRESLPGRIAKMLELRAEDPDAHRIIWHDLEAERAAIEDVLPSARYGAWLEFKDGNSAALELYERHYSARFVEDRELFIGPGSKMALLTEDGKALFGWRKFIDDCEGQHGVNCCVFRNEGSLLSSDLILDAMSGAWIRWPGERLYTYVDADQILSPNPGYCFKMAGWQQCGFTKNGLIVLETIQGLNISLSEKQPVCSTVYGTQPLEDREALIRSFSDGKIQELATKPVIAGAGCNFQRHCSWEIFLGIGFKFHDFIQAVHRVYRFLQTKTVRIDLIYTEAEREIRRELERKWQQHKELQAEMSAIIREYGLATNALHRELQRGFGCVREEASGEAWCAIHNDCVLESAAMLENSVDLILTSIPFSTQYEYSPSYNDFGHTDSNEHFWQQMDYLIPELFRVLEPGRVAAIHVKDRITPSGLTGMGFQTVYPFSDDCINAFRRHGFGFLARKTIVTDVVRENNQTYRLGWSEQCKDGSRMGCGMPEYLLLFRKPPTDTSNGYADNPVIKSKRDYTRSRWQQDAHGFARSDGNRLLAPEDLLGVPHERIFKMFRADSLENVYNFERHVELSESLERCQQCAHIHSGDRRCEDCECKIAGSRLPATFMLLQPQSWHPDVWTDIARMRTMNMLQAAAGKEMHLCPLQFDICDRVIEQFSMPGEIVFDPFMGIGTVPIRALKLGRRGSGVELSPQYYADAVQYLRSEEKHIDVPTLFDLVEEVTA